MGKFKGGKKRPNYFQTNITNFGPDFVEKKSPLDIQKDAKAVFNDIAYGNIDVERDKYTFTNINFLENLLIVATDNYWYHYYSAEGLKQIINQAGVTQISTDQQYLIKVIERHTYSANAYSTIIFYLQKMRNNEGVTMCLSELVRQLQSFKGAFADLYFVRDDDARRKERSTY